MAKLTEDQARALAELEQLRDAPDTDDEYEVVMQAPDGHSLRVPYSRVPKTWRERFGFTDPATDAGEGAEGGEGGEGDGKGKGGKEDPKPPSGNRYFR